VGSTPTRATHKKIASAGHWRAQVAVTHPPAGQCRFDSCPTHWSMLQNREQVGPFVYRHRTAAPQAAKAGSIPARVIHQKANESAVRNAEAPASSRWRLARLKQRNSYRPSGATGRHATLRTSCPMGLGVRLSPWSLEEASDKRRRGASAQWSLISSKCRVRHPDLLLIER
jgi:hypothetical protein